ncbi:MFS transporter [bacterium]|nr:MFS transporter [bacterium]
MKKNQNLLLFILAAISFTHILDFVIMMPLGPQLMRIFDIGPSVFASIVSSYTFSAGIFGFLGAFLLDRFDRKSAVLVLYLGFLAGTFGCAVADSHHWLVGARIVAGAFGGMLSALIFSVIGDVFPESQRGRATGVVMSSFSVASVAGVPLGLWAASNWGWHSPFFGIGCLGLLVAIVAWAAMPSMTAHIQAGKPVIYPMGLIARTLRSPNELWAILLNFLLVFSGFSLIPYISTYLVENVGLAENHLSWVYLCGGALTFFTSPIIGRLSDRFGKRRTFLVIALLALLPILGLPVMPRWPVGLMLIMTTMFFILVSGRFVPAMAMVTSSVPGERRGSFMSIATAVQQLGSGIGASVAGLIIVRGTGGELHRYGWVGILSGIVTVMSIFVAYRIKLVNAPLQPVGPDHSA